MGRKLTNLGLEKAFNAAIRQRDMAIDPRCRICSVRRIDCAYHLVPKSYGAAMKWNPDNAVGACFFCNARERRFRDEYHELHKTIFGTKFNELYANRHDVIKLSAADKLRIIECIKHGFTTAGYFVVPKEG